MYYGDRDLYERRMQGANTVEGLRRRAKRAGLRPGTKVRIVSRVMKSSNGRYREVVMRQSGVVVAVYPYIFVCEVKGHRTSYRYNELFGDEPIRIAIRR